MATHKLLHIQPLGKDTLRLSIDLSALDLTCGTLLSDEHASIAADGAPAPPDLSRSPLAPV